MESTSDRVLAIARDIVASEGPDAVSMRRVAAAAGITPMAIYRHFANREALLQRVADATFDEIAKRWTPRPGRAKPATRITHFLDDHLDFALAQPRLYDFVFTDLRDGARRWPDDFRDGGSPTISVAADAVCDLLGRDRVDDEVLELTLAVVAMIHGLVRLHHNGRIALSDVDFRRLCHRAVGRVLDGHHS
jgi:AcrR family transcriptional regulator